MQLTRGGNGAVTHHHTHSAEIFYILEESAQLLAGQQVLTATDGDLAVVPASMHHAFAASPGKTCDLLILITPGVQRFDYLRLLRAIARGERPRESLLDVQDRFDTHFDDSPELEQSPVGSRRRWIAVELGVEGKALMSSVASDQDVCIARTRYSRRAVSAPATVPPLNFFYTPHVGSAVYRIV